MCTHLVIYIDFIVFILVLYMYMYVHVIFSYIIGICLFAVVIVSYNKSPCMDVNAVVFYMSYIDILSVM